MPNQQSSPLEALLQAVDEAYQAPAWHGPNLKDSLRGVTFEQAAWKPGPKRHSIWEIMVHAAYWKHAVRQRLPKPTQEAFPEAGEDWFERSGQLGEEAFRRDLELLEREHQLLCQAVASLTPEDLAKQTAQNKGTVLYNVRGIAFHDAYHAGQIQLLRRLFEESEPVPR